MEYFIYATTNTFPIFDFLFPVSYSIGLGPIVRKMWGRAIADPPQTQYEWEINLCHLKPLIFEDYLLP